jgi:hypothetical protein
VPRHRRKPHTPESRRCLIPLRISHQIAGENMENRIDAAMERDVNKALAINALLGTSHAWTYMEYCRVPPYVILRVLSEPELRRSAEPLPTPQHGATSE